MHIYNNIYKYIFISKVYTCVIDPDIKWDAGREAKVVVSSLMS